MTLLDLHLDLHLDRPLTRGSLTLFPVWNGRAVSARGYDVGESGLAVTERSGAPVVGELVVANTGPRPVLLLEGELLQGGHQHRVTSRTTVVEPGRPVVVPVRCVEQGRWSGARAHTRDGRRAPTSVRAARSQAQTWAEVSRYEQRYARSDTSSLLDAAAPAEAAAADLVRGIAPLPFQSGVLIGVAGQPLLLEVPAVLRLSDGVDPLPHTLLALLPLGILTTDVSALDLDHRPPAARHRHDEVCLVLLPAFLESLAVEQHRIVRQLLGQRVPRPLLGVVALSEIRRGGDAQRHLGSLLVGGSGHHGTADPTLRSDLPISEPLQQVGDGGPGGSGPSARQRIGEGVWHGQHVAGVAPAPWALRPRSCCAAGLLARGSMTRSSSVSRRG